MNQKDYSIKDKLPKNQIPRITGEEMARYEAEAAAAKKILEDDDFEFLRTYLRSEKEEIVSDFVNNKILKIVEVRPQQSGGELQITHTQKGQEQVLAGRFKLIFDLLAFLTEIANRPVQAQKAVKENKLIIEPLQPK